MRAALFSLAIAILSFAALLPGAGTARADVVHAGLPIEALPSEGTTLGEIVVPDVDTLPIRVVIEAQQRPVLLVDVLVGRDTTAARDALRRFRRSLSRNPETVEGLGDEAYGGEQVIAFARDNVFVALRSISGARLPGERAVERRGHVMSDARRIDRAIQASPPGDPRARGLTLIAVDDPQHDEPAPFLPRGEVLAASVRVHGPGYARNGRSGWMLVRTGEGAIAAHVLAIDRYLRFGSP